MKRDATVRYFVLKGSHLLGTGFIVHVCQDLIVPSFHINKNPGDFSTPLSWVLRAENWGTVSVSKFLPLDL